MEFLRTHCQIWPIKILRHANVEPFTVTNVSECTALRAPVYAQVGQVSVDLLDHLIPKIVKLLQTGVNAPNV